jgi:cell fate regulator YaaT (PSP1 superfamily)
MACGSGGCSSGGCSTGGCNKLNTYDWLGNIDLPDHIKPFDIVEVRFKGTRKEYYRNIYNHDITNKDFVVVEMENGFDIGQVTLKGELVRLQLKKAGFTDRTEHRKIIRRANDVDMIKYNECKELEVPTMFNARTIALELGLKMKLSDVEYQADRRKATFYYTAEERVDFRELIKRLAEQFKVRIEMKQIGYREEAGRLGAIGSCGRELCCSTWLTDFKVVQTNAARYQNLSINQLKLSGQCGRLKCCLNFELDAYQEALKEFPAEDKLVLHFEEKAPYKAVKTDILKRMMWFAPQGEIGGEWVSFPVSKVKEYEELNKNGTKPPFPIYEKKDDKKKIIELDFKNDMGKDSITRLDERKKKPVHKNNQNKNNNPNGPNNNQNKEKASNPNANVAANPNPNPNPNSNRPKPHHNRPKHKPNPNNSKNNPNKENKGQ